MSSEARVDDEEEDGDYSPMQEDGENVHEEMDDEPSREEKNKRSELRRQFRSYNAKMEGQSPRLRCTILHKVFD